jgi:hypothetical protein
MRVARGESWSRLQGQLERLAGMRGFSDADYIGCIREAISYHSTRDIRALSSLLRRRPSMYVTEAMVLLDTSLHTGRSVGQLADLIEDGVTVQP